VTPGLVIVDLDGTLVNGNTYRMLVRALAARAPGPASRALAAAIAADVVRRARGRRDRAQLKRAVQEIAAAELGTGPRLDRFVEVVRSRVDSDVLSSVREARDRGWPTVLSTAALPEYAVPLATTLGFEGVVATSRAGEPWVENIGAVKRARTESYLAARGLADVPRLLVADHADDIPLAVVCAKVLWVRRGEGPVPEVLRLPNADRYTPGGFREVLEVGLERGR
jgi:phosphoserine phosphatase